MLSIFYSKPTCIKSYIYITGSVNIILEIQLGFKLKKGLNLKSEF